MVNQLYKFFYFHHLSVRKSRIFLNLSCCIS